LVRGEARLQHFRIDEDHSNAFAVWKRMGSPQQLTTEQYAQLETAGQLAVLSASETVRMDSSTATVRFKLPRQAVSLLVLEWKAPAN
jgi:xylan 1,4-beta-xylosidase